MDRSRLYHRLHTQSTQSNFFDISISHMCVQSAHKLKRKRDEFIKQKKKPASHQNLHTKWSHGNLISLIPRIERKMKE